MTSHGTTRIWETPSNPVSSPVNSLNHEPRPAQLPSIATLTNDLPSRNNQPSSPSYPSTNRTSDPWGSQTQSTRSSAYSSGFNYNSSVSSPHRASGTSQFGTTSYPADFSSPTSAAAQSPGFASPQHETRISQLSQPDPTHHRSSHHSDSFPPQESRRSSLGSQVNTGFNNLQINGSASPYATHGNPSHSSIAASLQRERGPQTNGVRNSGASSVPQQPFSPLGPQPGETRQAYQSRTAPSITHNPIREVYNADKPTVGQPYAFPDPDVQPAETNSIHEINGSRTALSRRNSHGSLASSVITNDSKYPSGQIRLDEDPMPGTHHHSLQSKRISGTSGDGDSPETSTPYSRTPALRASHKLAERKRRTEMKHLFDQLRAQIPAHHGAKSSKWEILSKASEYIKNLESDKYNADQQHVMQLHNAQQELEALRRENEAFRRGHYGASADYHRDRPSTANTIQPPTSYAEPPAGPQPMQVDPARSLPPLANGIHAGGSMQGVQYSEERR